MEQEQVVWAVLQGPGKSRTLWGAVFQFWDVHFRAGPKPCPTPSSLSDIVAYGMLASRQIHAHGRWGLTVGLGTLLPGLALIKRLSMPETSTHSELPALPARGAFMSLVPWRRTRVWKRRPACRNLFFDVNTQQSLALKNMARGWSHCKNRRFVIVCSNCSHLKYGILDL